MKASVRKQYLVLGGMPVLSRTLIAFDRCPHLDRIYLVVPGEDMDWCQTHIVAPFHLAHQIRLVAGGDRRQVTVANGLDAIDTSDGIVMIHDGVRPFVSQALINSCLEGVKATGACVPAVSATDTLKQVGDDGVIVKTLDRNRVRLAQTPQTFSIDLIHRAHRLARQQNFTATDDASVVEFSGERVTVVQGDRDNIKITIPADLQTAQAIIKRWDMQSA